MNIVILKLSVTNCFLVKNSEQYILIDMGYEVDWSLFVKRLAEANIRFSAISHIVLTHHHDDHCGLLNPILAVNKDIRVVMSDRAAELLQRGENDITHGYGFINKRIRFLWAFSVKRLKMMLVLKKSIAKNSNLKFPPYHLREKDILIQGETRLKDIGIHLDGWLIPTPGHTVDSISLVFDDGDCMAGDAAANLLRFAGTKYCVIGITDLDEYYQSWRRLINAHALRIFPAHGKQFSVEKLKRNIGKNQAKNMVMIRSSRNRRRSL